MADRIALNPKIGLTENHAHGLTNGYVQSHEPNVGEDSGMGVEVIAIPNDGPHRSGGREFPSQSAGAGTNDD